MTERGTTPARAGSLGERLGLDPAAFRKAWRPQRLRVIRGQVSFADALVEIGTALGRAPDVRLVSALAEQRRLEKTALFQNIDPIALSALRHLRQRGCRLAIVSNCFAEDVAAWPECAASACFDASVFSFEVGTAKPEPRIYAEALRRLGVDAFPRGLHRRRRRRRTPGRRASGPARRPVGLVSRRACRPAAAYAAAPVLAGGPRVRGSWRCCSAVEQGVQCAVRRGGRLGRAPSEQAVARHERCAERGAAAVCRRQLEAGITRRPLFACL